MFIDTAMNPTTRAPEERVRRSVVSGTKFTGLKPRC